MNKAFAILTSLMAAIVVVASVSTALAQQDYKTPEDAAAALLEAAKSGDEKAALTVFGPDGIDIISSGDPVNDANQRQKFVAAYDAKHQIELKGGRRATLIIGEKDWPFPVPIVKGKHGWAFDTDEGLQEILARRIGHNELATIQVCLAYVDAQNEYADKDRTGTGSGVYAQRFISETGKKDGLYWPAAQGEPESPLGELFAKATNEGYKAGEGRTPYRGYYYKILTKQGPHAPGGALDYVVNGKMIGGFALVAYPAEYRNSGVMTFLVSHSGKVFEKDLGPDSADIAEKMTAYDPGPGWKQVEAADTAAQ
jgi:hypothetical protein